MYQNSKAQSSFDSANDEQKAHVRQNCTYSAVSRDNWYSATRSNMLIVYRGRQWQERFAYVQHTFCGKEHDLDLHLHPYVPPFWAWAEWSFWLLRFDQRCDSLFKPDLSLQREEQRWCYLTCTPAKKNTMPQKCWLLMANFNSQQNQYFMQSRQLIQALDTDNVSVQETHGMQICLRRKVNLHGESDLQIFRGKWSKCKQDQYTIIPALRCN